MKKMTFLAVLAAAVCLMGCENKDNPTPETKDAVSVSPTSVTFEAEGGTLRVAVTTAAADYTVTGAPEWLTVTKNGKEISLTATANTVNQKRDAALTVTAGTATANIAVSQKAGSPYAGYKAIKTAVFEYSGSTLYMFTKPSDPNYGGSGFIALMDEDQNSLSLWVYTNMFESEEEVEMTPGTYAKGADIYPLGLVGTINTYVPGQAFSLGDEDEEEQIMGCLYKDAATGVETALVNGTIVVEKAADGTYSIKVDMKDKDNNAYKYAFIGEVTIDTTGATFPGESDRIDVANTVFGAECYYEGDTYENGTSNFVLQLYSGTEDDYATTTFEFNTAAVAFSKDMDLSGEYSFPKDEEGYYAAGTLVPGSLMSITETFSFPMGTYIMYNVGDYLVGDGYASLTLSKQENGKYTLVGAIMSQDEEMVMFSGADFTGIHDLEIALIDSTAEDDEED